MFIHNWYLMAIGIQKSLRFLNSLNDAAIIFPMMKLSLMQAFFRTVDATDGPNWFNPC